MKYVRPCEGHEYSPHVCLFAGQLYVQYLHTAGIKLCEGAMLLGNDVSEDLAVSLSNNKVTEAYPGRG